MLTAQQALIEIYYSVTGENDVIKYHNAVTKFEETYNIKAPYESYHSFKNAIRINREKKKLTNC